MRGMFVVAVMFFVCFFSVADCFAGVFGCGSGLGFANRRAQRVEARRSERVAFAGCAHEVAGAHGKVYQSPMYQGPAQGPVQAPAKK